MPYKKHFVAIESDPEIFTSLMHNLGVADIFRFVDIWSLEADHLPLIRDDIGQPVEALVLVLPDCPAYTEQEGQDTVCTKDIIWLKQIINNACGLYAILHCVCNVIRSQNISKVLIVLPIVYSTALIFLEPDSYLYNLMKIAPPNRSQYLLESSDLETIYSEAALCGSSEAPSPDAEVGYHYICLVKHSGYLYELDGDRMGPIYRNCLESDEDILSEKGQEIIKMYIDSCPDGNFSLLALIQSA